MKPNFIAGQKDTCENFQFSTHQDDSYSGIFPVALLYLFENVRMLLNWLLSGLTISELILKPQLLFEFVEDALTLTCFNNMGGVVQEHFELFFSRLPENNISAFTGIHFYCIILMRH